MRLNICFGSTSKGLKMGFKIIPEVEKILIGLIKAGYWLQYAQKLYWDHWRYFHGVEDGFASTPQDVEEGCKLVLEVTTMVEELTVILLKKVLFRHLEILSWGWIWLWKYSQGLKIGFESYPRGWRKADLFQKD